MNNLFWRLKAQERVALLQSIKRVPANMLFDDLPEEVANAILPQGYALAETGLYCVSINELKAKISANVERLTKTPFLISSKDQGSGRVCLLVRQMDNWQKDYVQMSRGLNPQLKKLAKVSH